MNNEHRNILRRNRIVLVQDLEPRVVLNHLYQDAIFSENDLEVVNSLSTRRDRAEKILDVLPRRGPKAFDAFYESLNSSGSQRHLADILIPKTPTQETCPPSYKTSPPSTKPSPPSTKPSVNPHIREETSRPSDPSEHGNEPEGLNITIPEISGRPPISHPPSKTSTVHQDNDVYPMNSSPHGLCLIVNNANFEADSGLNNRRGSNIDARNLQTLFTSLHYKVKLVENVRARIFKETVFKFAKEDHQRYDSVIVCLLSHGLDGGIYGVDGGLVSITDLVSMFKGNNTKDLVGKPKLFFIQACRGGDFDRGINFDKVDAAIAPTEEKNVGEILEEVYPEEETDSGLINQQSLPSEADLLIAYSTVPGFVSWRNQDNGSWFVQALVEVFKDYSSREDIVSMLVRINRKVALDFESACKKKQMPAPVIMLTRKLFFHPQG